MYYILIDKEPVPCDDEDLWQSWLKKSNPQVALTERYGFKIETEFMGRSIVFCEEDIDNTPLFFRTIVYDKNWKVLDMNFWSTWEEAEVEHQAMVKKYIKNKPQKK